MSGPPERYFDAEDIEELRELLALLVDWRAGAERDEQYAVASCMGEWIDATHRRLIELEAVSRATEGSARNR